MRKLSLAIISIIFVFASLFSACSGEALQNDSLNETAPAAPAMDNELGEVVMMLPLPPSQEPANEIATEFATTQYIDSESTTEYGMPPGVPPHQRRQIATAADKYEEEKRLNALFASLNESITIERILVQQVQRTSGGGRLAVFQSADSEVIEAWVNVFQAMELSTEQYEYIDSRGLMVYIVANRQVIPLGNILVPFIHNGMTTMTRIVNFEDLRDDIRHAAALISPDIVVS